MSLDAIKQFSEVYEMLQKKKKVYPTTRKFQFVEDFNNPKEGAWSSVNVKRTDVEYFYTNPQFNRMFAKLEDGRTVDYDLTFMQIVWNKFTEYIPPKPPTKKMTLKEVEEELGYSVEIIS